MIENAHITVNSQVKHITELDQHANSDAKPEILQYSNHTG